jgi:hypothetical protein
MRYVCQTLFDITATGVTGHFKVTRMPFANRAGQLITDQESWHRSRNQQRNWETITQILGLRTQLFDITVPIRDQSGTSWMFEFETETAGAFGPESDPCEILRADAEGVPMCLDLNNRPDLLPVLRTHGRQQNIWFAAMPINNRP